MRVEQQHVVEQGGSASPQRLEIHIHGCAHQPKQRCTGEANATRQQSPEWQTQLRRFATPCELQLTRQRRRAAPLHEEQAQQTLVHNGGTQSAGASALRPEATTAHCVGAQAARAPPNGRHEDAVHDAVPELEVVGTVERQRRQKLLLTPTARRLLLQRATGAWRHGFLVRSRAQRALNKF